MPLDVSNSRSLHEGTVPRIGGAAIAIGCTPALLGLPHAEPVSRLLLLAGGLSLLSLADDWRSLPIVFRLSGHFVAAAGVVHSLDLPLGLAVPGAVALVWMTNLFNFMDGSDGLAGGMAVIGFSTYGVAAMASFQPLAWACFAIAAAAAGFLVFNISPARVFMGDAGSIPLGFLAGAFGLTGWSLGVWSPGFPVLVFLPFLADATVTLLRRLVNGEKVWLAHRSHYYQRLVQSGWSHRRLAFAAWALMVVCSLLAIAVR